MANPFTKYLGAEQHKKTEYVQLAINIKPLSVNECWQGIRYKTNLKYE